MHSVDVEWRSSSNKLCPRDGTAVIILKQVDDRLLVAELIIKCRGNQPA